MTRIFGTVSERWSSGCGVLSTSRFLAFRKKEKKEDFRPLNHGVLVPLGFRKQQVILGCLGCHVSHAECHVSHAECHVSHAECHVSHAECHVSHAECHVSHVECHVSHAECHVFFLVEIILVGLRLYNVALVSRPPATNIVLQNTIIIMDDYANEDDNEDKTQSWALYSQMYSKHYKAGILT